MESRKMLVAAGLAAIVAAGSAQAATVLKSGDTVEGWKVTFPAGIGLVQDAGSNLTLEKSAAFTNIEGLVITFVQVSYTASPVITITDESVTNVTGQSWSGFQFLLANTLAGNAADAAFTGSVFTPTTPFGTVTKSSDTISLSGGTVNDGDTVKWGFGATGGQLDIAANPAASGTRKVLDFKEIPIAGVPLPTAAWSGLSGLVGLGLIGSAKKVRKLLA